MTLTDTTPPATALPYEFADQVGDCLTDSVGRHNGATWWAVHRHLGNHTAAVTYRGDLGGGAPVRAQSLWGIANALRAGGFEVREETCWPEQAEPVDGMTLWLNVTGYDTATGAP